MEGVLKGKVGGGDEEEGRRVEGVLKGKVRGEGKGMRRREGGWKMY